MTRNTGRVRARETFAAALMVAMLSSPSWADTHHTRQSPLGIVDARGGLQESDFSTAHEAGAIWSRLPIQWKYFETQDDEFNFDAAQSDWFRYLQSRGMHMSPVMAMGLCWANHRAGDSWSPTDPPDAIPDWPSRSPADLIGSWNGGFGFSETYYDYVFTFVSAYADQIDRITVENEVNTPVFWENQISDYIKVLATARKAAMDADPDVKVFDSGMGSGSWGAPVAKDRLDAADWTWQEARDFLSDYYHRDVIVRKLQLPQFQDIYDGTASESRVNAFLTNADVVFNYNRVSYVLTHLWSNDLNMMLVDGLNLKFTGDPWVLEEVVLWIDEKIADSVPPAGQGSLPLPKVNNEASNWCVEHTDWVPAQSNGNGTCTVSPAEEVLLAEEMVQKTLYGLPLGVEQSLWFPLSNDLARTEETPRLGLYDYDGNPTPTLTAHQLLGRFVSWRRSFVRRDDLAGGTVLDFVFEAEAENFPARDEVHVLWWDDGSHGAGSEMVTLPVPAGTIEAWHHTLDGDSTSVAIDFGPLAETVILDVNESPSIIYFDDGVTPIGWPIDPVPGPRPARMLLAPPMPSPSAGLVRVGFALPEADRVRLDIFDVAGRRVAGLFEGSLGAGTYRIVWDGRSDGGLRVAEGVYVVRMTTGAGVGQTRKLVRVR